MIENNMGLKANKIFCNDIYGMDRLVPYFTRIHEGLYELLESNRAEEIKQWGNYFKDDTYAFLI